MKQLLEALDLALEALELTWDSGMPHPNIMQVGKAITAIEQARSAPVQKRPQNCGTGYCSCIECVMEPAPAQEPVEKYYVDGGHIVYPAAQRQWVSLTADERYDIRASFRGRFLETSEFAEQVQLATEAKLKEKNT
jgi:hypothetical protein